MPRIVLTLLLPPILAVYTIVIFVFLDVDESYTQYALIVPVCYLLGSIPWGFLITMAVKGLDVREFGSGMVGTSNVLRTAGGGYALVSLALDASKGMLAVALARIVGDTPMVLVVAGLAALAGHNWPIFLNFRGGRGIATGLGGLLVMEPISGAIAIASFTPVTFLTRYLSLGSIASLFGAFLSMLGLVLLLDSPAIYLWYPGIGGTVIIWQHRGNIQRLLQGTERRLGQPAERIAKAPSPDQEGG